MRKLLAIALLSLTSLGIFAFQQTKVEAQSTYVIPCRDAAAGYVGIWESAVCLGGSNELTYNTTTHILAVGPPNNAIIALGGTSADGILWTGFKGIGYALLGNNTGGAGLNSSWFGVLGGVNVQTGTSYSVALTDTYITFNASGTATLTLPTCDATYVGRIVWVKTVANQAVIASSSIVRPLTSQTAGTAILSGTAGKWAQLVCEGASTNNWTIVAAN